MNEANSTASAAIELRGQCFVEAFVQNDAFTSFVVPNPSLVLRFEEFDAIVHFEQGKTPIVERTEGDALMVNLPQPEDCSRCAYWNRIKEASGCSGVIVQDLIIPPRPQGMLTLVLEECELNLSILPGQAATAKVQ
ncbi:hypothetical protein [Bifidobacterium adolescentis]|uniref:hypothetical protein n=1 Tax=Bifidobacterium adolescentis TaxID=1680 RepID=UPI001EDFC575|nr:hypothetical protein [Bifidobacterium adolescentis]MCG4792614.1 hypothetical protein [Bifidobacterium adolescentis]